MEFRQIDIDSLGYDIFIGRRVDSGGIEEFVCLDLDSFEIVRYGEIAYPYFILKRLCYYIRNVHKVLFNKSPGVIDNMKLETFTEDQMRELEMSYELSVDMKTYPNPFLSQP